MSFILVDLIASVFYIVLITKIKKHLIFLMKVEDIIKNFESININKFLISNFMNNIRRSKKKF